MKRFLRETNWWMVWIFGVGLLALAMFPALAVCFAFGWAHWEPYP